LATTIDYGSLTAKTVTFSDISEASVTTSSALYGKPAVSADALSFNPLGFGAYSNQGGLAFVDGQLTTTVKADSKYGIDQLTIAEYGDYSLLGTGSSNTEASVTILATLSIDQINNVAITPITVQESTTLDYNLVNNKGQKTWAASTNFNVDSVLAKYGVKGTATLVTLTFDNELFATSETTSLAYIAKKIVDVDVATSTTAVPEPGTLALLAAGALTLYAYRRCKRRAATANAT
jgi:hypothetical protein